MIIHEHWGLQAGLKLSTEILKQAEKKYMFVLTCLNMNNRL